MAKAKDKIQVTGTPKDINNFLVTHRPHIERFALSKHTNYREFELSALLAINDSWQLQACLKTPEGRASLRDALSRGAGVGLSVNPQEGKACIIAYEQKGRDGKKNGIFKASHQVMKNGMIELAMESGSIKIIRADLVRENDEFKISGTLAGDDYKHTPARTDRGTVDGYFAALMTNEGQTIVKWITTEEATEHGNRYATYTDDNSMFKSSPDGYAIKTVLKMLLRNFHHAVPELTRAITQDDREEAGLVIDLEPDETPKGTSPSDVKAKVVDRDDEPEPEPESKGSEGGDII